MTEDTKRQKSLLETVKEMVHDPMLTTAMWTELSAAIAREEAKKDPEGYGAAYWRERAIKAEKELSEVAGQALSFRYRATSAEANLVAVSDRAQQAEADAKWHREESARLSAELAKKGATLSAMTQAVGMLTTLHGSMPIDVDDPIGMARKIVGHVEAELAKAKESAAHLEKLRVEANELASYWARNYSERTGQWQERAEKAEAELERLRDDLAKASAGIERQKSLLIFREERCQKAEAELAKERECKEAFRDDLNSVRAALHAAPNETATDTAKSLIRRVDCAEAQVAKLAQELGSLLGKAGADEFAKCVEKDRKIVDGMVDEAIKKVRGQQSHPMDGGEITVLLNRAGVETWGKRLPQGMTTAERVQWLIESWESARMQVSNLERTRNALLDAIEKRKKESLDALNLLAKAIGGDS